MELRRQRLIHVGTRKGQPHNRGGKFPLAYGAGLSCYAIVQRREQLLQLQSTRRIDGHGYIRSLPRHQRFAQRHSRTRNGRRQRLGRGPHRNG